MKETENCLDKTKAFIFLDLVVVRPCQFILIFLTAQKTVDLLKSVILPLVMTSLHDLAEHFYQLPGYCLVPPSRAVHQVVGETLGRLKSKTTFKTCIGSIKQFLYFVLELSIISGGCFKI